MFQNVDQDPTQMEGDLRDISPESNTSDPLAPETPQEDVAENTDDDKLDIVKKGNTAIIEVPEIIIHGVIGKIVTNELNKLYAMNTKEMDDIHEIRLNVPDYNGEAKELYIYATDSKELNKKGLIPLLDNTIPATEKYKDVICLLTMSEEFKGNIDLATECLIKNNVKIAYGLSNLMSLVKEWLNK